MIVDSSALVAMALREAGYDLLTDKLSTATQADIGGPTSSRTPSCCLLVCVAMRVVPWCV